MIKTKIKKWGIRVLLIMVISLSFAGFALKETTHAVTGCDTGWTAIPGSPLICSKEINATEVDARGNAITPACPSGFNKVTTGENASSDARLVCQKQAPVDANQEQALNSARFLILVQSFLNRLLWPILVMSGSLMDNSLLFGGGMEERLRDIWIPIRNMVNILFVIVLVGIALYNVLGIGDENSEYSIKSMLPKIIIAIIAINFSFLAIKVFLDAVNVLTVSVFSLPGQVSEGLDKVIDDSTPAGKAASEAFCRNFDGVKPGGDQETRVLDQELDRYRTIARKYLTKADGYKPNMTKEEIIAAIDRKDGTSTGAGTKASFDKDIKSYKDGAICYGNELSETGRRFLKRWGSHNAALAMALNMSGILFYQELHHESFENMEKLFINTLFSVILYLVFAASFIALFAVLLARMVVLWLSIAISPILILLFAAPSLKDKLGEGFGKISEQFVKNAIAPLIIALAMTIGWIMLNAIKYLNAESMGGLNAELVIRNKGIPVLGLSTLQDLIAALGTVGIVWLGVFSAADGTLAHVATDWMKNSLQTAGMWLGKLPFKHIPFIPIKVRGHGGEEEEITATGGEVMQTFHDAISNINRPQKELSRALGIDSASDPTEIKDATSERELYRSLNRAGKRLAEPEFINGLKQLKLNRPELFNSANEKLHNKLQKLIEAHQKNPDDEKALENIAKSIYDEEELVKRATSASTAAAAPAAAAAATGSPLAEKESLRKGGDTPAKILERSGKSGQAKELLDTFNAQRADLARRLDSLRADKDTKDGRISDPDRADLRRQLEGLSLEGMHPDEAKLKELLSPANVEYLKKALGNGGERAGEEALRTILDSTAAPAPAGGAGAGAGTAPTGGAPTVPPAPTT